MSGQQWGSAVGFVAGFFLPGGPSVWATIVGAIGGAIDPTKNFGPRLSDGMAVTAQDGIPNPWGFGTFAVGCNIINAFDLVEHEHTDDGKGSGQENTTYTYSRSYALGICRAKRKDDGTYDPIAGILRATHNGKVVYNVAPDATPEQLAQNAKFLQTFKFYLGGEDQLPDPTLESYLGTGNVSAYRGQVYMVATDEDQQQHGSIGSWEFVVAMDGEVAPYQSNSLQPGRLARFANATFPLIDAESDYEYTGTIMYGVTGMDRDTFSADTIDEIKAHFSSHLGLNRTFSSYLGYTASTDPLPTYAGMFSTFGYSANAEQPDIENNEAIYLVYNDEAPDEYVDIRTESGIEGKCALVSTSTFALDHAGWLLKRVVPTPPGFVDIAGYCPDLTTWIAGIPALYIKVTRKRTAPLSVPENAVAIPGVPGFYTTPSGDVIAETNYTETSTGSYKVLATLPADTAIDGRQQYSYYETAPARSSSDPDYSSQAAWEADYDAAVHAGDLPGGWTYGDEYPKTISTVYQGDPLDLDLLTRDFITLSEVVAEICRRSGLEDGDFDVSDLTDTRDGFKVAVETTGEAVIQSLMQGFFFDCGEWDDKLRFIKRGQDVVAELTVDDLAERDGPAIEETQVQEVELLRKVSVKTMDPDAGYVETTQVAERRTSTVDAKGEQTLQIAIVADKDTQARIADKRLKVAWGEPRRFGWTLPYTRADLTVTDVIGLTDKKGRRQRVRLMEMSEDTGRIEVSEAMLDRQSNYTSNVEGVQKDAPTDTSPGIIGPTYFWAGNLPSLRTKDNVPGMYIAACGYMRAWGGAEILMSVDGGTSYQSVAKIITPSVMGSLTAPVTDSGEPIEVFINNGQLASITDEQVANRQNAFAITTAGVSELGQFKTATLGDPREYDLTDTVRGGLGTTSASHATGDPFVMVATAYFLPIDISNAGKTLKFKAVSFGTSPDDAGVYEVVFDPLFTSVNIEKYTTVAGDDYVDNTGSNYYRTS